MQVNATLYFTLAHMLDVEPEHVSKIMHLIRERQKVGEEKYGHTMDRKDYKQRDWRLELLGELLDGPQYAMAAGEVELATYLLNDAYRIQGLLENS